MCLPTRKPNQANRDTRMRLSQTIGFSLTICESVNLFLKWKLSPSEMICYSFREITGLCPQKQEVVKQMKSFLQAVIVSVLKQT